MPLSWNEIKDRALKFSKEWADVEKEMAEYQSFWNEFFEVFGISRRSVAVYQKKVENLPSELRQRGFIDLFWPGELLVEHKSKGKDLDSAFVQATDYILALKERERPRYVIVSDYQTIRLYDLEGAGADSYIEFPLSKFHEKIRLFGFIAGYTNKRYEGEDPVNVKAAELVGKLYDTLKESNYDDESQQLLLVRLVFCFFADDTGIFEKDSFKNYLENRTSEDGSDLGGHLATIFQTLNTPTSKRQKNLDEDVVAFPHIDGHLFDGQLAVPSFDTAMRERLLECVRFDWSGISPAVFGALFQSVMDQKKRHDLGAHYTSEKNILKVIRGLFLDDLKAELDDIGSSQPKLRAFHEKLARIRFLDPACGCGNFLVVTYRELRLLEIEVLKRLFPEREKHIALPPIETLVKIDVDCAYGIEIEEFPARIAELAMWLTDHQMNLRLSEEIGHYYARLPLTKAANIVRGNALRLDWETVVPKAELKYIFGNPPFVSKQDRTDEQKADMEFVFGKLKSAGELDYVTAWYEKASEYAKGTSIQIAFVSTNSIAQGEQVGVLWGHLLKKGIVINFAHRTFKWTNEARGRAAVFCVIIGFAYLENKKKYIYEYEKPASEPLEVEAKHINPYLIDFEDIIITARREPIAVAPEISFGSMPNDKGYLLFDDEEDVKDFLKEEPNAKKYIRPFLSAKEYFSGGHRYCLWLKDVEPNELASLPAVRSRIELVRQHRLASGREATKRLAETPALFGEDRQPTSDYILIPRVSSENRRYVPLSFFSSNEIAGDTCVVVTNATPYHFGILQSYMHMSWMKIVGGRLKSDYRYSNELVYNNFPWPEEPSGKHVNDIEETVNDVLKARKQHPDATLANLYSPVTMPKDLHDAHAKLDRAVDAAYGKKGFKTEMERLEFLFGLYRKYAK